MNREVTEVISHSLGVLLSQKIILDSGQSAFISSDIGLATGGANKFLANCMKKKICEAVDDPALHEALTPTYPVMCKRPVVADGFYETINQDNVTLVPLKGSSVQGWITCCVFFSDLPSNTYVRTSMGKN